MVQKKNILNFLGIFLLFMIPAFTISKFIDFDKASAVAFLLVSGILLYLNRSKIDLQKMAFPVLYVVLIKTKIGLSFMNKLAERYKEFIKLLGLIFIGIGFVGMIQIVISFVIMIFNMIRSPLETSKGVSLVVPFTNIPGIGYLSFWHFLIGVFVVVVIHEFAHGVVARAHDLEVKSSGVGFFAIFIPLIPLAFVEPDEKKIQKEKDHVQYSVFAAGPSINIIVAFIIMLLLPYVSNPYAYAPFEEKITEPMGISFSDIQEGYPAEESGLSPNTLIDKFDGQAIKDYEDFLKHMQNTLPGQNVTLSSKTESFTITTTSHPENETTWAYLGVIGVKNEREVKSEYMDIKAAFYWFKGLFKWLFILNFIVGLMNLLPIYITDGGRMFGLALTKIVKDKTKATRIYSMIALLFLATILTALIINYGSKLIGLV
ncbi:MAG: site-2 protease family protein [Nanoarchaeota archaeon]